MEMVPSLPTDPDQAATGIEPSHIPSNVPSNVSPNLSLSPSGRKRRGEREESLMNRGSRQVQP
jgi:hypothetical protein